MNERIAVPITMELSWRYASGEAMERFCQALRQRRILALTCPRCRRRHLPPRPFCGECRVRLEGWTDVADQGSLEAWTVVHQPITDSRTGRGRPVPYGVGLIRLDGADTLVNHYLDRCDPGRLAVGLRVRAVWRDAPVGSMDDISHFEVLG